MRHPARFLVPAFGTVLLIAFGIYRFGNREDPAVPLHEATRPVQPQAPDIPARTATTSTQSSEGGPGTIAPSIEDSAGLPAITAFRQWAETAAVTGFADADENKGMELAKARAISMKALIQKDPASALRQSLPAALRALLPPQIAATIEQPVQTTGMVSIQMICNHSPDAPHGNCESTPVLLEEVISWNAHYGSQAWQSYLGQEVGFEGVAVESELAVRSITPQAKKEKH